MVPIVSSMVLCTHKFVKGGLHVKCSYHTHTKQKGRKKLWEVWGMSVTSTEVTASQLFAYIQTHQIVYTKHVQFNISIYLSKAIETV